ncbi:MAG: tetratricopeptide repeat protein [Mariprofundaceae bacterium]|nr:tetratricopeptide repeat protein [Mariprofundaceae bacterium]
MKRIILLCTMLLLFSEAVWANDQAALDHVKDTMQAGRYATAIEELHRLLENEQDNYQAWFLFGVAQALEQRYNQAIEAFRQVIFLRPDLAEPHNNLAGVYSALGDPKMAVQELEKALQKQPDYAIAEENIANLYIDLALKHYRNSLEKAANPVVEQRFARLLQVRNPTAPLATKAAPTEEPVADPISSPTSNPVPNPVSNQIADATPEPVSMPVMQPEIKATAAQANVAQVSMQHTTPIPNAKQQTAVKPEFVDEEDLSITAVLDALEAWRSAWSAQDLKAYFSAYAKDYRPPEKFASLQAWRSYKNRVVMNKKFINISLEQVEVEIQGKVAGITLLQHFRSNTFNSDGRKQIVFKHGQYGWKIHTEVSF